MTHEDLLDKLNRYKCGSEFAEMFKTAVKEVVLLHKPHHYGMDWMPKDLCSTCMEDGEDYEPARYMSYPCPTIQAIEKELK